MITGYSLFHPSALRLHTGYKSSNIQYSIKRSREWTEVADSNRGHSHDISSLSPIPITSGDHQVRSLVLMVQFSHFLLCPQGLLSVRKWWDQHSTWSPVEQERQGASWFALKLWLSLILCLSGLCVLLHLEKELSLFFFCLHWRHVRRMPVWS